MLRLSKTVLAGVAAAALLTSSAASGQLSGKLDAQEQKLAQDEQRCGSINLAEYAQLLQEAQQNRQRADKAKKKGVPVDDAQVNADLAKAMQLFARAQMAQARNCMMQAQQQQTTTSPQTTPKKPTDRTQNLNSFDRRVLDAQNAARAAVGVPPLKWNEDLAQHATDYAQELARIGQLVHAPREGRGEERENLQKGLIGWSPEQMVGDWIKEERLFHPGTFPNVCDGDWSQCAHYTQVVWPTTTDVGCGMAPGAGFNWFVCRYTPGGNKDGKPVGLSNVAPGFQGYMISQTPPSPGTGTSIDGSKFASTGRIDHDFKYGFAYRNTPISSESAWDWSGSISNDVWSLTNTGLIIVLPYPDPLDSTDPNAADYFIFNPDRHPSDISNVGPGDLSGRLKQAEIDLKNQLAAGAWINVGDYQKLADEAEQDRNEAAERDRAAGGGVDATPFLRNVDKAQRLLKTAQAAAATQTVDTNVQAPDLPTKEVYKSEPSGNIDPDYSGPIQIDITPPEVPQDPK